MGMFLENQKYPLHCGWLAQFFSACDKGLEVKLCGGGGGRGKAAHLLLMTSWVSANLSSRAGGFAPKQETGGLG